LPSGHLGRVVVDEAVADGLLEDADERGEAVLDRGLAIAVGDPVCFVACKMRFSEAGVHLFDRLSGLNVLLDEVEVPPERVSPAPRYLSVAGAHRLLVETFSRRDRQLFVDEVMPALRARNAAGA